jgi:hypothetical protein
MAGCALIAAVPALAQTTTPPATQNAPAASGPTTNAPPTDAIGPRELQNFSLPGTAIRPSEQQPANAAPPVTVESRTSTSAPTGTRRVTESRPSVAQPPPQSRAVTSVPRPSSQAPAAPLVTSPMPQTVQAPTSGLQAPSAPPAVLAPATEPPTKGLSIMPWMIAALLLASATGFLLWRRRPRESYAGAREFDLFAAPEAEAAPVPQPGVRWMPEPAAVRPAPGRAAPEPARPQSPASDVSRGIVASRLRPALEIGVRPLRCLVEDSQVTLEFELDLFNAGTAPARGILAEASLLNASATQDQELGAFFSRPAAAGEPLDAIPPMKRMTMTSQVIAPRDAIHEYDLGGRKAFVPVIAFNAMYEWSSGKGQPSAAYLVGRETSGEKLGPLRLDEDRREVRGLGARSLPLGVRS